MPAGARNMDQYFRNSPLDVNMPALLALTASWYTNLCGAETQAILPHDNRLDRFPAFLQQLQKVYIEDVIWGINSFDQFGVELGKRLAQSMPPAVRGEADYRGNNGSTAGPVGRLRNSR